MAGRVQGKVALVTGGSSGIGRAAAERLAQEGATVVITDLQDAKGGDVVAAIQAMGGKADYLHHDVTQEQAWIDVMAAIKANHGRLDILVNNAGINKIAPFAEIEPIFRAAGGRPHWAKRHTLTARDVADLYPRAADFARVRAAIDPGAKFANSLMRDLFAIDAEGRA